MGIWYITREAVKAALDIKETARSDGQVDRAIEAASRTAEGILHRRFYPLTATKTFDWPQPAGNPSYRLWLHDQELVSLTSATAGGEALDVAQLLLEPNNDGPPYNRVETNRGGSATFGSGDTNQRALYLTGVWGYRNDEVHEAHLSDDITGSTTTVPITASATIGVGSLLRVGNERMAVTGRSWATTGQTGTLAAQNNATLLSVVSSIGFVAGEVLLLDAEKVRITDIAGNNLIVQRAVDGSVLAAHTSATIYAQRSLTVQRGALGTTAAAHGSGAAVWTFVFPGDLVRLVMALAEDTIFQERTGYARTSGSGDSESEATGKALRQAKADAVVSLGRRARTRAV